MRSTNIPPELIKSLSPCTRPPKIVITCGLFDYTADIVQQRDRRVYHTATGATRTEALTSLIKDLEMRETTIIHLEEPYEVDGWREFGDINGTGEGDDDGGNVDGFKEDDEGDLPQMFAKGLVLVPKERTREHIRREEAKKRRFMLLKRQGSLMSAPLTVPPPRPRRTQKKTKVKSKWGNEPGEEDT